MSTNETGPEASEIPLVFHRDLKSDDNLLSTSGPRDLSAQSRSR